MSGVNDDWTNLGFVALATDSVEGPHLLATKLHIPTQRLRLVDRSRIWELLDIATTAPLTVVSGPAGCGKTVAVATWTEVRLGSENAAWISLEDTENDPVLFWFYVLEALRQIDPEIGQRAALLAAAIAQNPADVLLPLIDDLAQRSQPTFVILDDYHVIDNVEVHNSVRFLLDHLPNSTHLVLTSRSEPDLGLAARRVRGELAELGPIELRFAVEDTAEMMSGLGVSLHDAQLQELTDQTEGWAAGLYLAGLSLRGHDAPTDFVTNFAGTDRHIVDFLASEVLDRLSAEVRTFLRRTAVLSNLTAGLCDAVVGSPGSQELLEELERSNLFVVPLDNNRRWYRYHQLFGDLLAFELERVEPGIVRDLHSRAGDWYRQNNESGTAITHFIAAERYEEAVELLLQIAVRYFNTGRWQTVERWVKTLPEVLVSSKPTVALSMAWSLFAGGRFETVLPWILRAEAGDTKLMTPWADGLDVATEAHLLRCFTLRAHGDFTGALAAGERARDLIADTNAPRRFVVEAALGIALYWAGDVGRARSTLVEAVTALREDRDRRATAELLGLGVLAAIALDTGKVDEAKTLTAEARDLIVAQQVSGSNLAAMTLAAEGRIALLAGDQESAERVLNQGLAMATSAGDLGPIVTVLRALSEMHHRSGETGEARERLNEALRFLDGSDATFLRDLVEREKRTLRRPWVGASLTERELELLQALPHGLSRREIAGQLHVSAETIKTHSRSLYRKLGVSTREDCVDRARELGLI